MIINSATLNGIKTSFNVIFNKAFAEAPSQYKEIAMDVPSTAAENTYAWLGMTTKFREWIGDRVIQNLETHGYTIRNKKFENTVGVSEDDIEDDKGEAGNFIDVSLNYYDGETTAPGLELTITQSTKGAGNASLADTIAALGDFYAPTIASSYVDAANTRWFKNRFRGSQRSGNTGHHGRRHY